MKKVTKLCLMIAGIFGAFGIALCVIGAILGGTAGLFSRIRDAWIRNTWWNFSSATEVVSEDVEYVDSGSYESSMLTFPADSVKNLDIQSDLGTVNIYSNGSSDGGNDEITADISSEYCTLNGDTLEIRLDIGAVADVYIPDNMMLESVHLEADTGEIYAETINCSGTFSAEADIGTIDIDSLVAQSANITTDTGSINIYSSRVTGDIFLEADVGSVNLSAYGSESDYNFEIQNDVGQIYIGGVDAGENIGSSGTKKIDNSAVKTITAHADTGQIEINFEGE